MKIKTIKWLASGLTMMVLLSVALVISGELEAMFAWWLATLLLLPGLLLSLRLNFVSLKVICLIAFLTQFVTVPSFFLSRDTFAWGHVKSFGFTAVEVLPIFLKVGAFLLLLGFIFYGVSRLSSSVGSRSRTSMVSMIPAQPNWSADKILKRSIHPWIYVGMIILVIAAVTPLNLWMFSQGISIVGVEPPRLPYKLSGILYYLTKFIFPVLLGYLYFKTRHNLFPAMLLLGYGAILGLSSVSRSAVMLVLLPVLAIAWLERKYIVLAFSGIGLLLVFSLVTQMRNLVYIVVYGKTGAVTDRGLGVMFSELMTNGQGFDFTFFSDSLTRILSRIEGFGNLVMANEYDPNAVLGPAGFILRRIWRPLAPIDLDLHHLQWNGNTLPEGFVNGGSLFSDTVIVANDNILWILPMALVTAFILLTLERCIRSIIRKYAVKVELGDFVTAILTIFFFIYPGSIIFVFPFLAALVFSLLPRLSLRVFITPRKPGDGSQLS